MKLYVWIFCLLQVFIFGENEDLDKNENLSPYEVPLYYWSPENFENFGDYLSLKLVERMTKGNIKVIDKNSGISKHRKFLAIGSILHFAFNQDVVWGSGINGKHPNKKDYLFKYLDIRAIRGPLSRAFLQKLSINCPPIYGDPALLLPYFFPEWKKKKNPSREYIIIPHCSEEYLFPKEEYDDYVVYPSETWDIIIKKILDSKLVIASSLHGIIVAEAFGIPAKMLRVTENEPIFKYQDYYYGTNRSFFQFATSVEEAIKMGGEPPFECDLKKLYLAFPFEFWPYLNFVMPDFSKSIHLNEGD